MRRDTSSWMCSDATSMHRYRAYAMRGILLLVRRQRVHSDSLRSRPSTVIFDLWMLGMKRVLVRRLEWLTLFPAWPALPHNSHFAISYLSPSGPVVCACFDVPAGIKYNPRA